MYTFNVLQLAGANELADMKDDVLRSTDRERGDDHSCCPSPARS